jgi:hypothetical protein
MTPFIRTLTSYRPTVALQAIDEEIAYFEDAGMPQAAESLKQDKQILLMSLEDI